MTASMTLDQSSALMGFSATISALFSLAMSVAFLVGAYVVRNTRPDAFGLLATSSGIHMGNLIVSWMANMFLPSILLASALPDRDTYTVTMVLVRGITTVITLVANGMLLTAILRLAKGPQVGNPFAEGRYQ